jgi:hypothetical protein
MWLGFVPVEVPPSPNTHERVVIGDVPAVDSSVKSTVRGASPLVGVPENAAAGGTAMDVMYPTFVVLSGPTELATLSETV